VTPGDGGLPSSDDFARVTGSELAVLDAVTPDGRLRAITVDGVEVDPRSEGRSFSVFFSGPGPLVLPQRTYRLRHDELGELELFLVPIGVEAVPAEGGQVPGTVVRYQAVFNRLPDATP
jgi:hypothetical protein